MVAFPTQNTGIGPHADDDVTKAVGSSAYVPNKVFDYIVEVFRKETTKLSVSRFYFDRRVVVDIVSDSERTLLVEKFKSVFLKHGLAYVAIRSDERLSTEDIWSRVNVSVQQAKEYMEKHPEPPIFVEVPGIKSDGSPGLVKVPSPDIGFDGRINMFGGDEATRDVDNPLVERALLVPKDQLRAAGVPKVVRKPFPREGQEHAVLTPEQSALLARS